MWIARNKDGFLGMHIEKPERSDDSYEEFMHNETSVWTCTDGNCMIIEPFSLYKNTFTNLTWKDEPIQVEVVKKMNGKYIRIGYEEIGMCFCNETIIYAKYDDKIVPLKIDKLPNECEEYCKNKGIFPSSKNDNNLTKVIRALQLEETSYFIKKEEDLIFEKYNMVGNPYCSKNIRSVSIPYSAKFNSDNFLYEYIVEDKVVVTIYGRRNEFNTLDLLITDFGI